MARVRGCQEAWQVVREEKRKREGKVNKKEHERRAKENINNLVDFIEGNDKKMMKKKKKKRINGLR